MATNKWLSNLKVLKASTDTLRSHLRNGNVSTSDSDTLQTLISKVPSLAPIEDSDKWQPDPLWKFPDPNGSGNLKTIREIWDEDTQIGSYTHRGIYQIIGEYDTIDLKKSLKSRTNADTFILSDGTTYTDITTNTLNHTWDKSKDVIDSKGRPMRYVRVYSKTTLPHMPDFYKTVIWAIHNMTSGSASAYADATYTPCECLELCDKFTQSITNFTFPYTLRKIVIDGARFNGYIGNKLSQLNEIEIKSTPVFSYDAYSSAGLGGYIKNFVLPSNYSNTGFTLSGGTIPYAPKFGTIDLGGAINITASVSLNYLFVETVILPPYAKSLYSQQLNLCEELILPSTLTTIQLNGASHLKRITLPESLTTISSFQNLYNLKELNIPMGFNLTGINLSNSTFMEHDSLVDILENLADLTGQSAKTITFGSTNLAKLTAEEKAIATNKNWTLS